MKEWMMRSMGMALLVGMATGLLLVLAIASGIYAVVMRPHYIKLDIALPADAVWTEPVAERVVWNSGTRRYDVWRQETAAVGFASWDEAVVYFETALASRGWERTATRSWPDTAPDYDSICSIMMGMLYSNRTAEIVSFSPTERDSLPPYDQVCLIGWPEDGGYHILLVTSPKPRANW